VHLLTAHYLQAESKRNVNMLIVRENTECLYVKRERLEDGGNTAIAERVITRKASTRIAELVLPSYLAFLPVLSGFQIGSEAIPFETSVGNSCSQIQRTQRI
jgi:hypothetical protein